MVGPENRLSCRLDGLTPATREQQRLNALTNLGLLETEVVTIFEEATQTAARFLDAPICILGLMTQEQQWIKSSVGLSRLGLMNKLAVSRSLPRNESFCTYVVDSQQFLTISDTSTNPVFASSLLVQQYGIRSYLGTPLLAASGDCLGTLAVMDLMPRSFTIKDIEFLQLTARWSLGEFERNHLLKEKQATSVYRVSKSSSNGHYGATNGKAQGMTDGNLISSDTSSNKSVATSTNSIKIKLLTQLALELRTPLTSIMGMASVLGRQVYGALTEKQKEYLEIIHNSGQHLGSLVDEILALEVLEEDTPKLNVTSVDIEMLCQQAINSLLQVAKQRQQQIRLSVEPGNRIWSLDKDKVRQMVYYLIFSVIPSAEAGSVIRIHISRKSDRLNLAVWVSHPWLGDSIPQVNVETRDLTSLNSFTAASNNSETMLNLSNSECKELQPVLSLLSDNLPLHSSASISTMRAISLSTDASLTLMPEALADELNSTSASNSRESLALLLSSLLAEINGGQIFVQGSQESGYRYVVNLPQLAVSEST